jgi:putative oxidoreductase
MQAQDSRTFLGPWSPQLLSVLRIVAGLLFFAHGVVKLFGYPPGAPPGQVPLLGLFGIAGLLEFVGGLALVLGLYTRPVAFVMSGEMAFAYFIAHAPKGFFPGTNGGEAAVLYCFIFLFLAAAGGGAWGIDTWRRRR